MKGVLQAVLLIVGVGIPAYPLFAQGAPTPEAAFNNGTPNQYWFELALDSDGSAYQSKDAASRELGFNEVLSYTLATNVPNPVPPVVFPVSWDESIFQLTTFTGYVIDFTGGPAYEEWFVIRAPSTGNLIITLDISSTPNGLNQRDFKSLSWYQADNAVEIAGIRRYNDNPFVGDPLVEDWLEHSAGLNGGGQQTNPERMTIPIASGRITKDYILVRIGNNDPFLGGIGLMADYTLEVSTTNNTCEEAMLLPLSPTAFSTTTNRALLDNNDEFDLIFSGGSRNVHGDAAGDAGSEKEPLDYANSNTSAGMWFRIENVTNPVYLATCGSATDVQMMVTKDICRADAGPSDKDYVVAAENQNVRIGSDHNPSYTGNPDPEYQTSGRGVCLAADNPDDPVMVINPAVVGASTALYVYVNGATASDAGSFNLYALDNPTGILPVTWLDFRGTALHHENELFWTTATETQNDYFLLEKSTDGKTFRTLGTVPGAGTTAFENSYRFIDKNPAVFTTYRIAQVDFDGTKNPGPEISVVNHSVVGAIAVVQNPLQNKTLVLEVHALQETVVTVQLATTSGKVVESFWFTPTGEFDRYTYSLPHLTPGIYIGTAAFQGKLETFKLVIQ
jgi:hypothetical protein